MKNLISMVAFVKKALEYKESEYYEYDENDNINSIDKIESYANFLSQPLHIGQFVPADENGNVLNAPIERKTLNGYEIRENEFFEYQKAKSKVLFEGFEVTYKSENLTTLETEHSSVSFFKNPEQNSYKNIENLLKLKLKLTPNALKQIGL